jgi:two-component system response regulator BaeR
VLVVEDDPKIAQLLLDYLKAEGLSAHSVADGRLAVQHAQQHRPAVILLDVMLPGLDGMGVCRAVRQFSDTPIIMLTARVDELDRLMGLDTGADDYVCKPFSPREVMARVRAQLRRAQGRLAPQPVPWVVDDDRLRIAWHGEWLALTVVEFRMLRLMLGQPGRVFSRAQLLDSVHLDARDVSDRAIDSHIKNLRRKLASATPDSTTHNTRDSTTYSASSPSITSVYGVGYCVDVPEQAGCSGQPMSSR